MRDLQINSNHLNVTTVRLEGIGVQTFPGGALLSMDQADLMELTDGLNVYVSNLGLEIKSVGVVPSDGILWTDIPDEQLKRLSDEVELEMVRRENLTPVGDGLTDDTLAFQANRNADV